MIKRESGLVCAEILNEERKRKKRETRQVGQQSYCLRASSIGI